MNMKIIIIIVSAVFVAGAATYFTIINVNNETTITNNNPVRSSGVSATNGEDEKHRKALERAKKEIIIGNEEKY